jgi:phospholipase C
VAKNFLRLFAVAVTFCAALTAKSQTLTPAAPELGAWAVGTTSSPQTVTLSNTQKTSLLISSITTSGNFNESSTCPIDPKTLAAGASCKILVTFTPVSRGSNTGTLAVNDNSSTSPQSVPLVGDGEPPVGLSPVLEAFGDQTVDTSSGPEVFTLQNYQTVPVTIAGISTSGEFSQTSTCPTSPNTLAGRSKCQISVTFTPTVKGAVAGELEVSDGVSNSPQTSRLTGTGTAGVALAPGVLNFQNQALRMTSAAQTATLTNSLAVPVTIGSISASEPFAQTSTCPVTPKTLAAGASCTISVTFTPTTQGTDTGTLTITDSGSASETVNLTGVGVPSPIQHVVIIFQENRTPDNLFHDPVLIARGADIASSGLNSKGQTVQLVSAPLANDWDMDHDETAFPVEYDGGKMDGANLVKLICDPHCPLPPDATQYAYVQASDVAPYFQMAEQYVFADRMFQTNQGPSFPAHQFIIAGTSAPSVGSDLFASEDPRGGTLPGSDTGCTAPSIQTVQLIDPEGNQTQTQYPCFEHPVLSDLLDNASLTWRYYTTSGGLLWTGPNAIEHLRLGPDWANVIIPNTTVLTDIKSGNLPAVSWVIPAGQASDHPNTNTGGGPSWVSSIVNAIGDSSYWDNTAILITWDDWGGWFDHVAPTIINSYEYGFRVPLVIVSPYARPGYISHVTHDFGSLLSFVESTYGLPSLGYADALADNLSDCFNFNQTPTKFTTIQAPLDANYFLNDKTPPTDPDDD